MRKCSWNFAVGKTASEAYPCLLKGTRFKDVGVLNNAVSHLCKVRTGGCTLSEQTAWIHKSAKALLPVVDEVNPIRPELVLNRDEPIFVHPNKVQTDEYSHLTLEQCCTQRSC